MQRLVAHFVERGTPVGLDTGCVNSIRRPPFPVQPVQTKPLALDDADLAKFAGRYVGEPDPVEVNAQVAGGKLKMIFPGEQTFLLAPVSPARFRIIGAPGLYVAFDIEAGRVKRAVLEQGGVPALTLVPRES